MTEVALQGVSLGFLVVFLVGPVFFSLLQTSIVRGFRAGALMSLGISLGDISFVLLSYFGLSKYLGSLSIDFGIIGGLIFIVLGLVTLLANKGKLVRNHRVALERSPDWKYFLKGLLVNTASPTVIVFWLTAVGSVCARYTDSSSVLVFFTSALLTILVGDLVKSALADKLLKLTTPRFLRFLNLVVAIVFIIAGIRLFFWDLGI